MHSQSTTLGERASFLARIQPVGTQRRAATGYGCLSYARQSTSIQDSIAAQLRCNLKTAQRLSEPVCHELTDTESGLAKDRPGYQELLRLAETGQYRYVLLFKADRLSRDDVEFVSVCRKLLDMGMQLEDYTIGPITKDNVGVLALLGYMELRNLSERTKMKLEDLAASGTKIGRYPLGYARDPKTGKWGPDPDLAPAVRDMFLAVARGETLASVQRTFNARTGLKKEVRQIRLMLRCEFYAGYLVQCKTTRSKLEGDKIYARPQKDWKVAQHPHPLIDSHVFERVQERLESQRHVGQQRQRVSQYALTGLIWCAACERRMSGGRPTARSHVYRCRVCGLQRGLKKTEGAILGLLAALPVEAHDVADAAQRSLAVQRERLDAELRGIDERLNELTARRVRLTVKLGDGLIDDDEYATVIRLTDKQRDELRARREQLAAERERVPAGSDVYERVLAVFAKLGNWTELPRKAAIEQQQEVYRCCVAAARYLPDRKTLQVQWTREIAPYMPAPVQDVVP